MVLAQHTPAAPLGPTAARQTSAYTARLARHADEVQAAQALRFEVFNLELDEGLVHSYDTGLDADPFDAVCDHLIVEDGASGALVGTYRLQTGLRARDALGYYSEREFDFTPFEAQRPQMLELGRACIHQQHRNFTVLNLLWKGIAAYARDHGARYLVGCSSLTSQDAATGLQAYRQMQANLAPPAWCTRPQAAFVCEPVASPPASAQPADPAPAAAPAVHIPRLLSVYLSLGAAICGPPAIDREFRTIDFLTWLDTESPAMQAVQKRGRFTA
jgi:putative hemolysin